MNFDSTGRDVQDGTGAASLGGSERKNRRARSSRADSGDARRTGGEQTLKRRDSWLGLDLTRISARRLVVVPVVLALVGFQSTVASTESAGASVAGAAGNSIVTAAAARALPAVARKKLGQPRPVMTRPLDRGALLYWKAPAGSKTATSLEYVVTVTPGGKRWTTTETTLAVAGLKNGVSYRFSVAARSVEGLGEAASSAVVTPRSAGGRTSQVLSDASRQPNSNSLVATSGVDNSCCVVDTYGVDTVGPLTNIRTGSTLSCGVWHEGDYWGEFWGDDECGTIIAVDGVNYGPQYMWWSVQAYTPVSHTAVTGSGTTTDPYSWQTIVEAGSTGIRVVQTDSYVAGAEEFQTDVQIVNTLGVAKDVQLWRVGDCFLQDRDAGFGSVSPDGTVSCRTGGRAIQFVPISAGSHFNESDRGATRIVLEAHAQFGDGCACNVKTDNSTGLN